MQKAGRILLHVAVWLIIFLLPYLVEYGGFNEAMFRERGIVIHSISTLLLITYAYFNHYFLVPKLYLRRKYFFYTVAAFACVLLVIWLPMLFRGVEGHQQPPNFGGGPGPRMKPPEMISKISYNIILFVISTFSSISIRQQKQLLEIQKEKLNAELSFLKAQINPHFLFNTLNSIYALAITKSDDTPKAITQLSELMRYILKDSDADTVPLDRELNYINNYVAVQQRRLGDTVKIEYSSPQENTGYKIAPLILVSFVENAFKHGVNPDQDSAISIFISIKNDNLHLVSVNNKVTSVNTNETMGIGLKNASARLDRLYPGKHQLSIEDNEKTFSVTLILDFND